MRDRLNVTLTRFLAESRVKFWTRITSRGRWHTAPSRELGSNIKPVRDQTKGPVPKRFGIPQFCTPRGSSKFWTAIDIIAISEKASLDGLFVLEGNSAWPPWVA
jgi:hypothetical protein